MANKDERRRAERIVHVSQARLLLCPAPRHPAPIDVTVQDYSETGIGVKHSNPLPIGQTYVVEQPEITSGGSQLYTVVRAEPEPPNWRIGLAKANTLDDPIEHHVTHVESEQRREQTRNRHVILALCIALAAVSVTIALRQLFILRF